MNENSSLRLSKNSIMDYGTASKSMQSEGKLLMRVGNSEIGISRLKDLAKESVNAGTTFRPLNNSSLLYYKTTKKPEEVLMS